MQIQVNKLIMGNVFVGDFNPLQENNIIEFSDQGIVVIYGPNGAGKTTLAKILGGNGATEFSLEYDGREFVTEDDESIFYNIEDQNGRNIIKGGTEDFILGDEIKREYELKKEIEKDFDRLYKTLISSLKSSFGISTKSSPFNDKISNTDLVTYISDLANNKAKGKNIEQSEFLSTIASLETIEVGDIDEAKYQYLIDDYKNKKSIIAQILKLVKEDIQVNEAIKKIEENEDAIGILEKYDYLDDCLVCDRDINRDSLLVGKRISKEEKINALDDKTKEILDKIINAIGQKDPFNIKRTMLDTISDGDFSKIVDLTSDFDEFFNEYNKRLTNFGSLSFCGV